jgi:hypothetical protein
VIGLPQGAAVPQQAPSCLETRRARVVFPDLFLYRALVSHFPVSRQFRAPRAWCLGGRLILSATRIFIGATPIWRP